jgi:hypothetical protein
VSKGALFAPLAGDCRADRRHAGHPGQRLAAALDTGKAKVAPDTVGIARP